MLLNKPMLIIIVVLSLLLSGTAYYTKKLLQDCNKTEYNGDKWKDIVNYVLDLKSDLDKCNEDKKATEQRNRRFDCYVK
jgi:hypothetical protein